MRDLKIEVICSRRILTEVLSNTLRALSSDYRLVVGQFEILSAVRWARRAIKQERTSTESSHRRLNRWPPGEAAAGAGEEWRATTKHDGAEVEPILIDKTGLGKALRQDWSAN